MRPIGSITSSRPEFNGQDASDDRFSDIPARLSGFQSSPPPVSVPFFRRPRYTCTVYKQKEVSK